MLVNPRAMRPNEGLEGLFFDELLVDKSSFSSVGIALSKA
jgi:hypothetical protein